MKYFLGIDPGKKGGYAVLSEDGRVVSLHPFDKGMFLGLLDSAAEHGMQPDLRCCLEKVHAMPKQGAVSMFSFGESYGWLKGCLDLARIPYQEIPPQTWKKEFGLNSDKELSAEVCRQLFPDAPLIPAGCRKPHDGMAEALLMAEYARRKL